MILLAVVTGSLGGLRAHDALLGSTETVVHALSTARADTLASRGGSQYGVHFASTTVTIFPGSTWSPTAASTTVFQLVPGVLVSDLALEGGGADIVFQRLTGKTSQPGTVSLLVRTLVSTIVVQSTGSISSELQ